MTSWLEGSRFVLPFDEGYDKVYQGVFLMVLGDYIKVPWIGTYPTLIYVVTLGATLYI